MSSPLLSIYETPDSRFNFLKGCIRLATSDGVISADEQNFITNASIALELTKAQQDQLLSIASEKCKKIKIKFENTKQKIIFMKEAIHLCYSDGHYADVERVEIAAIAKELKVSDSAVSEIEDWVVQGMDWVKAGQVLLEKLEHELRN